MLRSLFLLILLLCARSSPAQPFDPTKQNEIYWHLSGQGAIVWDVYSETRLPRADNIEMSGRKVSVIVTYRVDENKRLHLVRDVIFPQLRVFLKSTEKGWRKYRAYLRHEYDDQILPQLVLANRRYEPGPLDSVRIAGMLQFYHRQRQGMRIVRTLMPSMTERLFVEKWTLTNQTDSTLVVHVGHTQLRQSERGVKGRYERRSFCDAPETIELLPGSSASFAIYVAARLNAESWPRQTYVDVEREREQFLSVVRTQLVLDTPDSILNTLFYFSKIRAAESIFDTKMGVVHSPGGGRYYTGVWANDQCEYSGPFFPYLGYELGNQAALNAYLQFKRNIPEDGGHFWSSFEMEGDLPCCGADRGDAAMIAFGASHFALARGNREIGETLWPLITWSLDYCERQKNEEGVIRSDTDEMEGRMPTGEANLSSSSLYYGALMLAADLARALGKGNAVRRDYLQRAAKLKRAIESYFGADIDGLHTYKYFKEHRFLRHWICLPLVVGIEDRRDGTIEALFSRLWMDNGVRVEYNPSLKEPNLFWDRGTLYAFRGVFRAGAANRALSKLHAFSQTRLLGFHVPYVVEAWPEGNMAHLSAESALYCRIFTEGVLGITPTGFHSFMLKPQPPTKWNRISLRNMKAFGESLNVIIIRENGRLMVEVEKYGKPWLRKLIEQGDQIHVQLR